jgi:integrase
MSREERKERLVVKQHEMREFVHGLLYDHFDFLKRGNVDESRYTFAVLAYDKALQQTTLGVREYRKAMQVLEKYIHEGNINFGWNLSLPDVPVIVRRHQQTRQQTWFLRTREATGLAVEWAKLLESKSLDAFSADDLEAVLILSCIFMGGIGQSKVLVAFLSSLAIDAELKALEFIGERVSWRDVLVESGSIHTYENQDNTYLIHRCFIDAYTVCILRQISASSHKQNIQQSLQASTEKTLFQKVKKFCKRHEFIALSKISTLASLCSAGLVYLEKKADISSALYEAAIGNSIIAELPTPYWSALMHASHTSKVLSSGEEVESAKYKKPDFSKKDTSQAIKQSNLEVSNCLRELRQVFSAKDARKKLSPAQVLSELHLIDTRQWGQSLECLHAWLCQLLHPNRKLKVSSVRRYYSEVVNEWVYHTANMDLGALDDSDFSQIYNTILGAVLRDEKRNYKARCLQELHDFGVRNYHWPPLTEELCHHTRTSQHVNAGYISYTFYRQILDVISSDKGIEKKQNEAIRLMIVLAYRTGLRIGELVKLRLRDVEDSDARTLFVVNNKFGNNKSLSARRKLPLVYLLHPDELQMFNTWCGDRSALESFRDELLFPASELTREPFNPQKLSQYVNSVMRALSPALNYTFHHFRHTCLSNLQWLIEREFDFLSGLVNLDVKQLIQLSQKIIGHPSYSIERYWALASFAGHSSPATTFRNYLHFNQWILSRKIMSQSATLSKKLCENLLGYGPKKVTRRLMDGNINVNYSVFHQHVMSLLSVADVIVSPKGVSLGDFGGNEKRVTDTLLTYKILEEYQSGIDVCTLAIRYNIDEQKIYRWIDSAAAIANLKTREGGFRLVQADAGGVAVGSLLPARITDRNELVFLDNTILALRNKVRESESALNEFKW